MLLNASVYIVFALLLIISALLLLVVLMQRPKQEGLGAAFGGQMTDQVFGAQTTDVLKKATALFGTLFIILCFVLGVLMNAQAAREKGADLANQQTAAAAAPEVPVAPVAPADLQNALPAVPAVPAVSAAAPAPAAPPGSPSSENRTAGHSPPAV